VISHPEMAGLAAVFDSNSTKFATQHRVARKDRGVLAEKSDKALFEAVEYVGIRILLKIDEALTGT
jgi:hypothetical protein